MNYRAHASSWDTELFNYDVGTLDITHLPRISRIREDNRKVFDVVFVKLPGWVDVQEVEALDYRYDMELPDPRKEARKHPIQVIECIPQKHLDLASRAFVDSRFSFDRRLKSRAYEIYPRWLSGADRVYTFSRHHQEDAFVAVSTEKDIRRISLIAVSEKVRSLGLGETLLRAVFDQEKKVRWRVRVSARNYRAIRFYESLGFRMKEVSTAFHVWVDGEED